MDLPNSGNETVRKVDPQKAIRGASRIDDLSRLRGVSPKGLLAEDCQSPAQSRFRLLGVQGTWGRNDDSVNGRFEQLIQRAKHRGFRSRLGGAPGQFITMARRRGEEWYVGSMTNWEPREFELPLSFLGPGRYRAEIYADAEDADRLPKNVSITRRRVDRTMRLKVRLAPGGGCAIRLARTVS